MNLLDNLKENSSLFIKEYSESIRQNSNWITQVVTISGSILSGFVLIQNTHKTLEDIGLLCLFCTICFGLFLMYHSNRKFSERILESFMRLTDYTMNVIRIQELSSKLILSKEENEEKAKLEKILLKELKEMGIINKINSKGQYRIGSVFKKYLKTKSIDTTNYLLIAAFFISGLMILISKLFL